MISVRVFSSSSIANFLLIFGFEKSVFEIPLLVAGSNFAMASICPVGWFDWSKTGGSPVMAWAAIGWTWDRSSWDSDAFWYPAAKLSFWKFWFGFAHFICMRIWHLSLKTILSFISINKIMFVFGFEPWTFRFKGSRFMSEQSSRYLQFSTKFLEMKCEKFSKYLQLEKV